MKAAICSVEKERLKKTLERQGFQVVTKDPDFVLCYGGDGTILYGERVYPTVPKLLVKTTALCRKCDYEAKSLDDLLEKVKKEEYIIVEEMKLDACLGNKKITALNEVQVHTA